VLQQVLVLALDHLEPADPAADIDADAFCILFGNFEAGRESASSMAAIPIWIKRPIFLMSFFSMKRAGRNA